MVVGHGTGGAQMRITRFSADAQGESRFSDLDISYPELLGTYGLPLSVSLTSPSVQFATLPEGTDQPLHPVGQRQLVVVLEGRLEVGTTDGQRREFGAGSAFLADDMDTPGHTTRTIDGAVEVLFVRLPEGGFWSTA